MAGMTSNTWLKTTLRTGESHSEVVILIIQGAYGHKNV